MKILGWLIAFGFMLGAMALGGHPLMFIDLPSVCVVVGISSGVLLSRFTPAELRLGLRALKSRPSTESEQRRALAVLTTMRLATLGAGAAGFLMGIVMMLGNLADPSAIGPAMAVALLSTLYAVVLSELIIAPSIAALSLLPGVPETAGGMRVSSLGVFVAAVLVGTSLMGLVASTVL